VPSPRKMKLERLILHEVRLFERHKQALHHAATRLMIFLTLLSLFLFDNCRVCGAVERDPALNGVLVLWALFSSTLALQR